LKLIGGDSKILCDAYVRNRTATLIYVTGCSGNETNWRIISWAKRNDQLALIAGLS
jgi:hypothetical protein